MIEEANAELIKDASFSDLYKKYLNVDLSNPEIRDEVFDCFVDKIYPDDDGRLSFVLKLYDKDPVRISSDKQHDGVDVIRLCHDHFFRDITFGH